MGALWRDALTGWSAEQRAAGLAETTIRMWRSWLARFATSHPRPWQVTRTEIINWEARHAWQPETRRSARAALRSFYRWGHLAGKIEGNPTVLLPRIRVPRARPRPAPDEVIRAAITAASLRVRLMILLAAVCGLRRAEVSRVHSEDLVGTVLRVHGKGGVERDVPVPASLAALLRDRPPGWMFPSRGTVSGHLTADYVGKLMSRAIPGRWTPHTLRHAAATAWHASGLDLHELAELLGHASVRTTQIYTAIQRPRLADGVEAAARRLDDPAA